MMGVCLNYFATPVLTIPVSKSHHFTPQHLGRHGELQRGNAGHAKKTKGIFLAEEGVWPAK
jgi:hypothetical protein